jgi:hypothetical protein
MPGLPPLSELFVNQLGATRWRLRRIPSTGISTGPNESSGSQKFNSPSDQGNKRFSGGLTVFGYFTWSKSFSLANAIPRRAVHARGSQSGRFLQLQLGL